MATVCQGVNQCRGECHITGYLWPARELQVSGNQHAASFVVMGAELEEQTAVEPSVEAQRSDWSPAAPTN